METNRLVEIDRRKQISEIYHFEEKPDYSQPELLGSALLDVPDQKVFLINLGHRQQNPTCEKPALRFLGAFDSKESLLNHIKQNGQSECTLYNVFPHNGFPICKSIKRQINPSYCLKRKKEIEEWYTKYQKKIDSEFKKTVMEKAEADPQKTGIIDPPQKTDRKGKHGRKIRRKRISSRLQALEKHSEQLKNNQSTNKKEIIKKLDRNLEIRNQNYVVISFYKDPRPSVKSGRSDPEPLVFIYGVFNTVEESKKYIKNIASKFVNDMHLYIIDAYEFIFIDEQFIKDKSIEEEWRKPEENLIMKQHDEEQKQVLLMEEKYKQEGKILSETIITPDSIQTSGEMTQNPLKSYITDDKGNTTVFGAP